MGRGTGVISWPLPVSQREAARLLAADASIATGETVIFADALSPSLLKHLLKAEGGAQQNDSLADG